MARTRKRWAQQVPHPAGSKLVRRFIRDARGENVAYRKLYLRITGKEYA